MSFRRSVPFEGEWSRGHINRLLVLNGLPVDTRGKRALKARMGRTRESFFRDLAEDLGIGIAEYIQYHTLVPFDQAVALQNDYRPPGQITPSVTSLLKRHVAICEQCIRGDSVPYLRRDHQLPGLEQCPQHGVPLRTMSPDCVDTSPASEWIKHSTPVSDAADIDDPIVRRYAEVALSFAKQANPLSAKAVDTTLRARMTSMGLEPSRWGLWEYARDVVPLNWSRRLFDRAVGPNDSFAALGHIAFSNTNIPAPAVCALAVAVVYEDVEVALQAFERNRVERRSINTLPATDYAEAFSQYVARNGSRNGINRSFAPALEGLPNLKCLRSKDRLALQAFLGGTGLVTACSSNGASTATVEQFVRLAGARLYRALSEIQSL